MVRFILCQTVSVHLQKLVLSFKQGMSSPESIDDMKVSRLKLKCTDKPKMKKVNKQCLLDTPRTVRVSEKTWQVIVRTRRP